VTDFGPLADCGWCETRHGVRWLCDPVKTYLDAVREHAGGYDLPDMAITEPVQIPPELGDVLMRQFLCYGATAEVGGVYRPVIVVTGRDSTDKPLPRYTFIGSVQQLQRIRDTFNRMVSLSITAARKQNGR
jgi:hypothetical protein